MVMLARVAPDRPAAPPVGGVALNEERLKLAERTIAKLQFACDEEIVFADLRLRRLGPSWVRGADRLSDQRGDIHLLLQMKGQSVVSCGERRVLLSPGDWILCSSQTKVMLETADGVEQLLLIIPRAHIGRKHIPTSDLIAVSAGSATGRLVACFILSIAGDLPSIGTGRHYEIAATATQLINMALVELQPQQCRLTLRETTLARIKAYVFKNIRDPDLTLESVATAVGCTKRYLHKAFQDENETLNEFIWHTRLDHCRKDLLDRNNVNWSITAIAFSWGFNNAAHFSRAFRDRFGMSPSELRKQAA